MNLPRTTVFGPAYLDVVLRIEGPILRRDRHPEPLDRSVMGRLGATGGSGVRLIAPDARLVLLGAKPAELFGGNEVVLAEPIGGALPVGPRRLVVTSCERELGGMGAGFARAFGGTLICALGDPASDPGSRAVAERLHTAGIAVEPICLPGRAADWTLLLTSGPWGDKLAIGFRGGLAALGNHFEIPAARRGAELLVVASLTNALVRQAIRTAGAGFVLFAPSRGNLLDRSPPVVDLIDGVDLFACNRGEWQCLAESERELVAGRVALLSVTDGPAGSWARCGEVEVSLPAFPRDRPPLDTNRAGEAYASTLVRALWTSGWRPGAAIDAEVLRAAAIRASAAAALVLDRAGFGFATDHEVDRALRRGRVGG